MKTFQPFEVVVPCSTTNLGPGFDSIGMALNRYLSMRFYPSQSFAIDYEGEPSKGIDFDENNLVIQVMKGVLKDKGETLPTLRVEMKNEIPLTRGLGSSAAAIVGGVVAANHLMGNHMKKDEMFQLATKWEGHPDNVGAALFGGLVITTWDGTVAHHIACQPPDLPIITVIPKQPLSTKLSRDVLPSYYARKDAVLSSSKANLLVAAFLTRNWELLSVGMKDYFHQPYREQLVPGLKEVLKNAYKHGAYGAALSGAGPTIIAFAREKEECKSYLERIFHDLKVPVIIQEMRAVTHGAITRLLPESESD